MGFKKQAMVTLSAVSLLATSIGLTNSVAADMMSDTDDIVMYATTCSEAQNTINRLSENAPNFNSIKSGVRITEDCSANLVIPSGKTVFLSLYSEDENGQRVYHSLTDNGSDTITVEDGASFYYEGKDDSDGYITNTTNGRSIVNNSGKVHIIAGNFRAENGAYTFNNSGSLDVLGGKYTEFSVNNSGAGKTRIIGGTFDNTEEARLYVVAGMKLDESTKTVIRSGDNIDWQIIFLDSAPLPVGYSCTVTTNYADFYNAREDVMFSSDESILKITGSNKDGWTITVVGVGESSISTRGIRAGSSGPGPRGYIISSTAIDTTESLTKYLVNKFLELIRQAVEDGKTISADVTVSNRIEENDVADVEKTEIAKVTGNDSILGYYDIALALNGDGEKLTDIHDLGNDTVEVSLPADFVNDLEEVKSGYRRNYYVVRYHDGVAEKINATLNGDKLVFRSGKFSTYAVAYTDTKIATGGSMSGSSNSGTSGSSNTNSGSNTGSTSSGNSNSANNASSSNTNVGAPDTGVASILDNGGATVTIVGAVVIVAIASGVYAYKVTSKRERREK